MSYFSPALFRFLEDLRRHNNRAWFEANKARYESDVRDPVIRFIIDFEPRLRKISRHYVADPRRVGGSLFRIYRDTRFSADKSPYKTMAGAMFRHEKGRVVPAPVLFLHLEKAKSFAGIGLHHPDPQTLAKVRHAIALSPSAWRRSISGRAFKATCAFFGERLKRPPKGYGSDHPSIEDLKRRDYCTMTRFTDRQVCAPDFLDRFTNTCRTAAPFMEFLTGAVKLVW